MNRPNTTASPAQRVANAVNRVNQINQPTYCKECGSVYFVELHAAMFSPAANGLRSISSAPMKMYMCLCGKLQAHPGYNGAAPAGTERAFFGDAMTAALNAQEYRSMDAIAKGTVSPSELNRVRDSLNDLIERFNQMAERGQAEPMETIPESAETAEVDGQEQMWPEQNLEPAENSQPLPIANGLHGRSVIASTPAGADGTRWVETAGRPATAGGARARMKRQGA